MEQKLIIIVINCMEEAKSNHEHLHKCVIQDWIIIRI